MLNAITVKHFYSTPRMHDCIDSLGSSNVFGHLDAKIGYIHVPVKENDRDTTAFLFNQGFYSVVDSA